MRRPMTDLLCSVPGRSGITAKHHTGRLGDRPALRSCLFLSPSYERSALGVSSGQGSETEDLRDDVERHSTALGG